MKKQIRKILLALTGVGILGFGSIGSTVLYGRNADDAKGWKMENDVSHEFLLDDKNSTEYQYTFINNLRQKDEIIGNYIPPETPQNKTEHGIVKSKNKVEKVDDFIKRFQKTHDGQYPLFKIKTGYFNFDNRYLAAVSPDNWSEFVKWYVGDSKTSGYLSYGPEAGIISTFQIVPGVERKGGKFITLGGYAMKNKERSTITFYPDAFFGTSKIYNPYKGKINNRLADYLFKRTNDSNAEEEFTIDQVRGILDLINKINTNNDNNPQFPKDFGTFGENSPHPLAIEPSKIVMDENGRKVQKYKILTDFYTAKTNDITHKSLLEKVAEKFPEVLTSSPSGYYIKRDENGKYSVGHGPNKQYTAKTNIGLIQILAVTNENFKGFGIDFLKYVGIHEYGHHKTLINSKDISEDSLLVGAISSKTPLSADMLWNFKVVNEYLKARSNGLELKRVSAYGNKLSDRQKAMSKSPYGKFKINGKWEKNEQIVGEYKHDKDSGWASNSEGPHTSTKFHRAFQNSLEDMKKNYVDRYNLENPSAKTTLYNAFLMNSMDNISGTLNPQLDINMIGEFVEVSSGTFTEMGLRLLKFLNHWFVTPRNSDLKDNGKKNWDTNSVYNLFTNYQKYRGYLITNFEFILLGFVYYRPDRTQASIKEAKYLYSYWLYMLRKYGRKRTTAIQKFIQMVKPKVITHPGGTKKFYDTNSKSWISLQETIAKLTDNDKSNDGFGKKILTTPRNHLKPDINLESIGIVKKAGITSKFDLINPKNIIGSDGTSFFDWFKPNSGIPNYVGADAIITRMAKRYYIENILMPIIIKMLNSLDWSIEGPPGLDQKVNSDYRDIGPRPEETNNVFSDYTYSLSESMTRDFVQITLAQEDKSLKNVNPFLRLSQSGTSFEFYIDKKNITKTYNPQDTTTYINNAEAFRWATGSPIALKDQKHWSQFQRDLYKNISIKTAKERKYILIDTSLIKANTYLAKDRFKSNGYEKDRQLRRTIGWHLYDDDATPRSILPSDNIKIKGPRGETPTSWAQAYWYFLLKMKGIGKQNITGFFRDPDADKVYMYGYIDTSSKDVSTKSGRPKYLAFKNKANGKIVYKEIYYQNTNTLFYLTHQGDIESKHNIGNENFVAWSTNKFTAGQYISENIGKGTYEIYFANKDYRKSSIKFSLGERKWIAENGKYHTQAPTKLYQAYEGASVKYIVSTRFHGG